MSTTPTTPQIPPPVSDSLMRWLKNMQAHMVYHGPSSDFISLGDAIRRLEYLESKFNSAPSPAAQPTDEAKLREVIEKAHEQYQKDWNRAYDKNANAVEAGHPPVGGYPSLVDRILTALAPHLSQREPGDSELLKFIRDNCRVVFYPPNGAYPIEHAPFAKKDMWEHLKSAQRGEGKP